MKKAEDFIPFRTLTVNDRTGTARTRRQYPDERSTDNDEKDQS